MKRSIAGILSLMIALCLLCAPLCGAEAVQASAEALLGQLRQLDGVISVDLMEISADASAEEPAPTCCMITFEQPIDWEDPSLGTFPQRVMLAFAGSDRLNVYHCDGYTLPDIIIPSYYQRVPTTELSLHYDANLIEIEYRFFGKSAPEGLSFDSEAYWEYLTYDNACRDFHHIITQLKRILPEAGMLFGASKGGYTTEYMAASYPDDIEAYVSYVAPLCDGTEDPRFYRNLFETICDLTLGEEKAAAVRSSTLELMKLMLDERYRPELQAAFLEAYEASPWSLSPLVTTDEAYEASVTECFTQLFQYDMGFDAISDILDMPEETSEQLTAKTEALKALYLGLDPVFATTYDAPLCVYYIQAYREMGNVMIDLSYLRNAGANVKTPAENDLTLARRLWAPITVDGSLPFDASRREWLLDFFTTTDKEIILIEGLADTWYSVRMPELQNPHIHRYAVAGAHSARIDSLDEDARTECYAIIDRLLGESLIK